MKFKHPWRKLFGFYSIQAIIAGLTVEVAGFVLPMFEFQLPEGVYRGLSIALLIAGFFVRNISQERDHADRETRA